MVLHVLDDGLPFGGHAARTGQAVEGYLTQRHVGNAFHGLCAFEDGSVACSKQENVRVLIDRDETEFVDQVVLVQEGET